jgi:thioredoxin-like negative regulator of GroEL
LDTYRQNTIVKQRDKYKQERELEKKQHKQRVDSMIESKVKEKFSKYDTLSKQEQLNKYEKILEKISQLDNNTDINNKQKTVLNMIKVVIEAKKNSLG